MKKENGITLVTLIVYLMIVSAILAALTNLSSHIYKNINKLGIENLSSEEFNKFNVNFVKSVKANKNATVTNNNQNVTIEFDDGTTYNYINGENSIYKNKIKIAKNINYFTAKNINYFTADVQNINNKNVIQVQIGTGKKDTAVFGKTINYVLKYW